MSQSWEPIKRDLEIQEAWKLGNLEVWRLGGLESRKTGGLETRRPGGVQQRTYERILGAYKGFGSLKIVNLEFERWNSEKSVQMNTALARSTVC